MRAAAALLLLGAVSACGVLPQSRAPSRPQGATAPAQPAISRPQAARCLGDLRTSGALYAPLPDRYYAPGCQAVGSVRLDRLSGDNSAAFAITNLGPVACPLAQAFSAWARYGVDRAARQMLGSGLQRIETMGSYSCRVVAGSTRLSAHSRAEAIDIGAFVLTDGRRVSVKSAWKGGSEQEQAFLRTVHASACKRFGTVLGPAYNAAHADHFHVELGNGSFCR